MSEPKKLKTITYLRKMRTLLSDPEHWTKGVYARNKDGKHVYAVSEEAQSFCMVGAMRVVTQEVDDAIVQVRRTLNPFIPPSPSGDNDIVFFNDNPATTHDDVMKVINTAIANERKAEPRNRKPKAAVAV